MAKSTGYQGYKNYETWFVALWLNNDQASYNALEALKAEPESIHRKAEQLEELVRELCTPEPVGIVADLVNAAFARVDWAEVLQD